MASSILQCCRQIVRYVYRFAVALLFPRPCRFPLSCLEVGRSQPRWIALGILLLTPASGTSSEPSSATGRSTSPPITAIVFAPDGLSVLVGSQRGVIQHSWPEMDRIREIPCNLVNLHALAFSSDGEKLGMAGGDPGERGIVELFAWPSGRSLGHLSGHDDCVMAIDWIDETTLVSGSLDHQVMRWDVTSGSRTRLFSGHSKGVTAVCALMGEGHLISAGIDQSLRVWDLASGDLVRSLNNHTLSVHALAKRPGNPGIAMVASASDDRTIRLWQPTIGRMVRFVRLPAVPLALAWLSDGSRIIVAGDDGKVRWIDPEAVSVVHEVPVMEGWIYCVAVHPSDNSILVGGSNGQWKRLEAVASESVGE